MFKNFVNSQSSITVSVPGSMMLFGEHAVLCGKMAIVTAIDSRLKVTLEPCYNKKDTIYITSSLGKCKFNLQDLHNKQLYSSPTASAWNDKNKQLFNKLQFVIESIKYFNTQHKITTGFNLSIINNDLQHSVGFGSSASVVVGVLAVMNKYFSKNIAITSFKKVIFKQALLVVHKVQNGLGSGADLAASIYGGIISYKKYLVKDFLPGILDLTAVYCGYKTKTADVITIINKQKKENLNYKKLYNYIINSMDEVSKLAIFALKKQDLFMLGKLMDVQHGLLSGIGVVDAKLDYLASNLRAHKDIYGSKVSGSGLGDCVIGLGKLNQKIFSEQQFIIKTANQGLTWL